MIGIKNVEDFSEQDSLVSAPTWFIIIHLVLHGVQRTSIYRRNQYVEVLCSGNILENVVHIGDFLYRYEVLIST